MKGVERGEYNEALIVGHSRDNLDFSLTWRVLLCARIGEIRELYLVTVSFQHN